MKKIVVAAIAFLTLLIIGGYYHYYKITSVDKYDSGIRINIDDINYCTSDSDCIVVTNDCSDCQFVSISNFNLEKFIKRKQQIYSVHQPKFMSDAIFTGTTSCAESRCITCSDSDNCP